MRIVPKPLSTQATLLLGWLSATPRRRISPLTAHTSLGIAALSVYIAELRKSGVPIEGEWEIDKLNRRHMSYALEEKA